MSDEKTYQQNLANAQKDTRDAAMEYGQDSEEAYWAFKREREVLHFGS